MNFKTWLEIVEPMIPKGYRRKNVIKNATTNVAKPMVKINFTTSLKNKVEVQFIETWDNEYQVIFYVNNVLDDQASATEGIRDPEILPGVVGLMKREADKAHIRKFEFTAHGESIQGPNTSTIFTQAALNCSFKTEKSGTILASAYCNIHGLWESAKELSVE